MSDTTDLERKVTFTELRNNARKYFDAVERGAVFEVYRHGKPVAILAPFDALPGGDRWKSAAPIELDGGALSAAILAERADRP